MESVQNEVEVRCRDMNLLRRLKRFVSSTSSEMQSESICDPSESSRGSPTGPDIRGKAETLFPRLRSDKFLKRPAVKGNIIRCPIGHKRSQKYVMNKAAITQELEEGCKLNNQKNSKQSQEEVREQDQRKEPKMKLGMSSFRVLAYWRDAGQAICYICGENTHTERSCLYNYIYAVYNCWTCRADCSPGQHTITSMAHYKFLRCFVRVNNIPPSFRPYDLESLFKTFGPLLMWDVPRFECRCCSRSCRGFGGFIFKNREDGEKAIEELNGYDAGGRKLRVDWAYPCL